MKLHQYTIAMLVMLLGLPLGAAPQAGAQDLSLDPIEETADEETSKPKKKKKSKKKSKKKKATKQTTKADADEQTEADEEAIADDATANDVTADNATANDATANDVTADDATADDATADDATDENGDKANKKSAPKESKVAQALRKFKPVSGKPNMKADYYIYMYSASWCGYCKQCMPDAVAEYKKIRRSKKVEFIVIGGDKSRDEAKAYLKEYKAKMPCIYFDDVKATKFMGLPGCGMPGFPAISVADKDGKVVKTAVGAAGVKEVIKDWKKFTINRDKED